MSSAVLTLDEMPTGWTTWAAEDDEDDSGEFCGMGPLDGLAEPRASAETQFQQSDFGPYFFQAHALFDDGRGVFDLVARALGDCQGWIDPAEDGLSTDTRWRVSPLSFPKLADDTFAMRASTTDVPLFGVVQFDMIFVRRSDVVSIYAFISIGPVPPGNVLEELSRKGDRKLELALN